LRPQIRIQTLDPVPADPYSNDYEKAVIVSCLVQPDAIADVSEKLTADDFDGSLHYRIMDVLLGLHGEGRKPSIEAVCAVIGDSEVAPTVTIRDYLRRLIEENLYRVGLISLPDAIETVLDASQRRRLSLIGSELTLGSGAGYQSVSDLAQSAMMQVDEVMASMRTGKRRSYLAAEAADSALKALEGAVALDNPTTGLLDLDKMIGGWPKGQLSIVAGRPGMGKSLFAVSAIRYAAKAGYPVAFFSLEMLDQQLGARLLSDMAYTNREPINYEDIAMRRVDERGISRLRTAYEGLKTLPIHIEEQRGLTVADIIARATKLAGKLSKDGTPLGLVVVDHIGLVRASDRYKGMRHRELAEISDGLATLAKDLDVAVIGLCQLNRGVEGRENKRPSLADLRESGAIEEDASVVMFLYRAAYYLEKQRYDEVEAEQARQNMLEQVCNKIEIAVDKNRNGRVGIIDAFVDVGANALRNASYSR